MRQLLVMILLSGALYVAPGPGANLYAGELGADLTALREGSIRKLVIHKEPRAPLATTFYHKDGTEETLAETNGKIRIVNFWATWCAPCRAEKPALNALQKEFGGADFEVLALATGRNSPDGIARFNSELNIDALTTRLDPKSQTARDFAVLGLPVSVIIDRQGREIARLQGGAEWDSASARAIVERLIAEGR